MGDEFDIDEWKLWFDEEHCGDWEFERRRCSKIDVCLTDFGERLTNCWVLMLFRTRFVLVVDETSLWSLICKTFGVWSVCIDVWE